MTQTFAHGYALLIGVTENQVARWALPDVAKDIAALAGVLAHPDRCGYAAEQIRVITGPAATRQGILDGRSGRPPTRAGMPPRSSTTAATVGAMWRASPPPTT